MMPAIRRRTSQARLTARTTGTLSCDRSGEAQVRRVGRTRSRTRPRMPLGTTPHPRRPWSSLTIKVRRSSAQRRLWSQHDPPHDDEMEAAAGHGPVDHRELQGAERSRHRERAARGHTAGRLLRHLHADEERSHEGSRHRRPIHLRLDRAVDVRGVAGHGAAHAARELRARGLRQAPEQRHRDQERDAVRQGEPRGGQGDQSPTDRWRSRCGHQPRGGRGQENLRGGEGRTNAGHPKPARL